MLVRARRPNILGQCHRVQDLCSFVAAQALSSVDRNWQRGGLLIRVQRCISWFESRSGSNGSVGEPLTPTGLDRAGVIASRTPPVTSGPRP